MSNEIQKAPTGQRTEQMGVVVTGRSGEMASNAMAAKQKALVEARYVIAYNRPRSILQARADILAACQRPAFAESARYKKPVGGGTIDGFSIRFAEEAIKAMKNIAVESTTIYEDESKRTVQITVTDLESNVVYGKEVTVAKTVERQNLKAGQSAISQRTNSYGKTVYLVEATEDDISNKVASAESKIIRNCGLRLVPSDILEEAEDVIETTVKKGGGDKQAATKKIVDSFGTLNIGPQELEKYLKHSLNTISPKELSDLRAIYAAVKDGEASWADYLAESEVPKTKPNLGGKKKEPEAKTAETTTVTIEAQAAAVDARATATESQDGDLGPQTQPDTEFAISDPLRRQLEGFEVPLPKFRKWAEESGWNKKFLADSESASKELIAASRSFKHMLARVETYTE